MPSNSMQRSNLTDAHVSELITAVQENKKRDQGGEDAVQALARAAVRNPECVARQAREIVTMIEDRDGDSVDRLLKVMGVIAPEIPGEVLVDCCDVFVEVVEQRCEQESAVGEVVVWALEVLSRTPNSEHVSFDGVTNGEVREVVVESGLPQSDVQRIITALNAVDGNDEYTADVVSLAELYDRYSKQELRDWVSAPVIEGVERSGRDPSDVCIVVQDVPSMSARFGIPEREYAYAVDAFLSERGGESCPCSACDGVVEVEWVPERDVVESDAESVSVQVSYCSNDECPAGYVLDSEKVELVVQKKLIELLDGVAAGVKTVTGNEVVCDVYADGEVVREGVKVPRSVVSRSVSVGDQFRVTFGVEGDVSSDVVSMSYAGDMTSLCSAELRDVVVDAFYVWGAGAERVETYLHRCDASDAVINSIVN